MINNDQRKLVLDLLYILGQRSKLGVSLIPSFGETAVTPSYRILSECATQCRKAMQGNSVQQFYRMTWRCLKKCHWKNSIDQPLYMQPGTVKNR